MTHKCDTILLYGSETALYSISDPPGAPRSVQVIESFKTSMTLTWVEPAEDGGSPVLGYIVERRLASSSRWVKVNTELASHSTLKIDELVEDNVYVFRVYAENKVGRGPPSKPSDEATSKDPWGKFLKLNNHVT